MHDYLYNIYRLFQIRMHIFILHNPHTYIKTFNLNYLLVVLMIYEDQRNNYLLYYFIFMP